MLLRYYTKIFLFGSLLITNCIAYAQTNILPIEKSFNLWYESDLMAQNDSFHSCIYPRVISEMSNYSVVNNDFYLQKKSDLLTSLMNGYPLQFFSKRLSFYPIINWTESLTKSSERPYYQSIGIGSEINFNTNWSAGFDLYGVRQNLDILEKAQFENTGYIREGGKMSSSEGSPFTYLNWGGYMAYQAGRYFRLQIGKGVHFLGDGYRSLWLSDNASSFPYAQISANLGKLRYIVLYQFLKDIYVGSHNNTEEQKYSVSHLLSWNIGKRLNLNLFETVVWGDRLDNGGLRGFDFNYWNPLIFYRPVEYSLGSADNILMGAGGRIRIFKNTHLYGQVIVDEFNLSELLARSGSWFNKFGYQAGVKSYNLLDIEGLFVRAEYNRIRPFTYSHRGGLANYGHLYRPLAHPFGANLNEYLALINYQTGRWQFQAKAILTMFGTDRDSLNMGQNIYRPYQDNRQDNGNTLLQGNLNRLIDIEMKASYIINPMYGFRVETGFRWLRWNDENEVSSQPYLFFGLRTNVFSLR